VYWSVGVCMSQVSADYGGENPDGVYAPQWKEPRRLSTRRTAAIAWCGHPGTLNVAELPDCRLPDARLISEGGIDTV